MANLKYLLRTKEGRDYVALCLVGALHTHKEIRPGLPRDPYPAMSKLDDRSAIETESVARQAELILHVNKSRDTDQGWVVIKEFPGDFIKTLPLTVEVEQHSFAKTLGDLVSVREQVTELQSQGAQLKKENRALRKDSTERNVPDFVKWWRRFHPDTRQKVYDDMGCDPCATNPVNSAKNSARSILQWSARSSSSQSWDRFMAAKVYEKKLQDSMDCAAERAAEITKLKLDIGDLTHRLQEVKEERLDLDLTNRTHVHTESQLRVQVEEFKGFLDKRYSRVEELEKQVKELEKPYSHYRDKAILDGETINRLQAENAALEARIKHSEELAENKQAQCNECGDNIYNEEGVCNKCAEQVQGALKKQEEKTKELTKENTTARHVEIAIRTKIDQNDADYKNLRRQYDELKRELGKEAGDWKEKWRLSHEQGTHHAGVAERKAKELEVTFKHISYLEQLLGKAVVDLNKAGAPKSPWREKYEKLHEKYLHQTPTGEAVDLGDEVHRLERTCSELENNIKDALEIVTTANAEAEDREARLSLANAACGEMQQERDHLKAKLASSEEEEDRGIKLYDNLAEEIIDLLVPDFYDVTVGAAQSGADIQQITDAIKKLVHLAHKKEVDFQSQLHKLFEEGKSDTAIAEYYDMDENEHAELLIALARVRWDKEGLDDVPKVRFGDEEGS